jgi:plasmid maintenance system antidote protein VapI
MTALQLQRLLGRAGLSQRGAAKALGINERTMRKYCAGDSAIPKTVELAILWLESQANPQVKPE